MLLKNICCFVAIILLSQQSFGMEIIRICSTDLTVRLEKTCPKFNTKFKKSDQFNYGKALAFSSGSALLDQLFKQVKKASKRAYTGIIDECCKNSCTDQDLREYCDFDYE